MATKRIEVTTTHTMTFEIEINERKYGHKATKKQFIELAELYARDGNAPYGIWCNPLEENLEVLLGDKTWTYERGVLVG